MSLLTRLAESGRGVTLTDLAQQVGLAPSTTHRLLATLEQARFVRNDPALGRWSIGVATFTVGNAFLNHRDVVAQSRPFMYQLMVQTGETVNIAVLDQQDAVFVSQVESHEIMRMSIKLGSRAPLHASGVGKALLARVSATDIAAILHKRGLPRFTVNTLDTPAKLRHDLEQVRNRGYAIDDQEHAIGLRCVAATIHDERGEALAAISLSGPRSRVTDDRIAGFGLQVHDAAASITDQLGGHLPD